MTTSAPTSPLVIDVHSHFFPQGFLDLIKRKGQRHGAEVATTGAVAKLIMPGHPPIGLAPQFVDVAARLAYLDARGVQFQALSLSPPMIYWAPPDLGVALARAYNDGIAEICTAHPSRFLGLATLPLQDVEASLRETERATQDLGMRGIYLATSVRGHYLDEQEFWPMWELAQTLGLPVFTHPHTHLGPVELGRFHLFNTIGFPTETAVLAGRLIYSGLLRAYPRVQVVLAHAGGTLPLLIARLDHAYHSRADLRQAIPEPPSAYLRHFIVDTITHDDRALQYVIGVVGAGRVVLGTDVPYDMADHDPVTRVKRLDLMAEDEAAILGITAARLLRIPVTQTVTHG